MALDDLANIINRGMRQGDGPIDFSPMMEGMSQQDDEYGNGGDIIVQQPQNQQQPVINPYVGRGGQLWDREFLDRMITDKRPPHKIGEVWITEPGPSESAMLMPLDQAQFRRFSRDLQRIQAVSCGELSAKVTESRQQRLLWKMKLQRSRKDVVESGNLNERESWLTTVNKSEQQISYQVPQSQQKRGFFGSLLGGGNK